MNAQSVILAAGGTGGHIFPAEALAEELLARGCTVTLITDKRSNQFNSGLFKQLPRRTIRAGGSGGGIIHKITSATNIVIGTARALRILKQLKPDKLVGFGGYPSFPTVYAATMLGIPTIIHEQNSVLGRANRMLAGRASLIATSFPDTKMITEENSGKVVVTGNPVRAGIRGLRDVPYPQLQQDGKLHVLITGGSQGASVFSEIIPAALALLPQHLRARLRIDQQCREVEIAATRAAYDNLAVNADLASFFVDIPARLAASHLVIARAGASTIAELTVSGRPAILIPLPNSMDNHQYHNANALEEAGGGWLMAQEGFTPQAVAARLEAFLTAPEALTRAAEKARKLGNFDAEKKLANLITEKK